MISLSHQSIAFERFNCVESLLVHLLKQSGQRDPNLLGQAFLPQHLEDIKTIFILFTVFEHLNKDPLCPFIIRRITCCNLELL